MHTKLATCTRECRIRASVVPVQLRTVCDAGALNGGVVQVGYWQRKWAQPCVVQVGYWQRKWAQPSGLAVIPGFGGENITATQHLKVRAMVGARG